MTMVLEPKMNGVDGTTDVASDLGGGLPGFEDESKGLPADLVGVADAWHDVLGTGGMRIQSPTMGINEVTNYHANANARALTNRCALLKSDV